MKYRAAGCLLMAATLAVSPICAQEQPSSTDDRPPQELKALQGLAISGIATAAPRITAPPISTARALAVPAANIAVYSAFGMLQVLDIHSTHRAIANNAVEANPLLRPMASSPAALVSLKAASGVGVLYLMERVRKKHPAAALALAIGINSMQAMVVMHNYRVARR